MTSSYFLAIIQHHNLGPDRRFVMVFHIWIDTEVMTLIFDGHLETVLGGIDLLWCWIEHMCEAAVSTTSSLDLLILTSGDCYCTVWPSALSMPSYIKQVWNLNGAWRHIQNVKLLPQQKIINVYCCVSLESNSQLYTSTEIAPAQTLIYTAFYIYTEQKKCHNTAPLCGFR